MKHRAELRPALIAAAITFLLHLIANPHYGFFRDELYFIICGQHPQWGYVDQPPVVPLLAALTQLFGHSLLLLRAVPALCAAAAVYIACAIVRELGADRYAQWLAAAGTFFAPELLSFGMKVSPDEIGLWAWPLAVLCVLRVIKGQPRMWLGAGAAIGISLESKYSVAFFAVALVLALLLSAQRRILFSRWFALGAGLAFVIGLPSALWQAHYGFPMLELLRNGQLGKNVVLSPLTFLSLQLLVTNPVLSLMWIAGLVYALLQPPLRWLAYMWCILMGAMIAAHGKMYYPGDVYPVMFALGAVAISVTVKNIAARTAIAAVALAAGLVLAPVVLPVLPERDIAAYLRALHLTAPETEHRKSSPITDDFADMHGWPQLAQTVARVYESLPPAQQHVAAIMTSNYGEAAAIDFFGKQYAPTLPPALSRHNQYFLWGPHGYSGDVLIDVDGDCGKDAHLFRTTRQAAVFSAPWVIPSQDNTPVMVCQGIKTPLTTLWPSLKEYE